MKKLTIRFCLLLLFFLCASCATVQRPQNQPPIIQTQTRADQVRYFQALNNWDLAGVLAIRTQNEADSLHWRWQQQGSHYVIHLFGPLGIGNVRITGKPGSVTLETANGKKFTSQNADDLLMAQTGWPLPVSNLFYWIRTLPVPNVQQHAILNTQNQLATLTQKNWTIQYNYSSEMNFPSRLTLQGRNILIKVVVKN
ncbi:MAG: lipoprotein insertase outer membrane protein LolB [Gammaproteobacteria bacterium]|nr:lipoprotein insertase outer membrane protein LolB [Gammaproteobacteria bacterium]